MPPLSVVVSCVEGLCAGGRDDGVGDLAAVGLCAGGQDDGVDDLAAVPTRPSVAGGVAMGRVLISASASSEICSETGVGCVGMKSSFVGVSWSASFSGDNL